LYQNLGEIYIFLGKKKYFLVEIFIFLAEIFQV